MKMILKIIVFAVIVAAAVLFGYSLNNKNNNLELKAETVKLQLNDTGNLDTQVAYAKEVGEPRKEDLDVLGIRVPFTGAKKLFSVPFTIKAGMDFREVNLEVDNTSGIIKIKLPDIKVHSCEGDYNNAHVWDESNSVFQAISLPDTFEEITKMKETATQDAINNGLLENAEKNAKVLIEGFVSQGFDLKDEYKIQWTK